MNEITEKLRTRITGMPEVSPPSPWKTVCQRNVSTLVSVGYDKDSDLILIDHYDGPEIINAITGESVAVSDEEVTYEESLKLQVNGFGPLKGKQVSIQGIYGGGLPRITKDGWQLESIYIDCYSMDLILVHPGSVLVNWPGSRYKDNCDRIWDASKRLHSIRSHGFSYTGRSFVIATEGDFAIYAK